jgi:hypothetical protein
MKFLSAIIIALSVMVAGDASARGSTSLDRVVWTLKSKVEAIVSDCGSRVVSTDQRGGKTPNHAQGKAVDVQGNPACIYKHLKGWEGGYTTDYATAPGTPHVHISYSREHEWGKRFTHGKKHKHKKKRKRKGRA